MKLSKVIWGACCLSTLFSCESFLDVTPQSVANVNAFYKTRQDALVATNAAYNALQELHREPLWLLGEVTTDNTEDPNANIDNFIFDAADGTVTAAWRSHYLGIARANTVLARLPGIAMDGALKERLMLEARFLRAYYYFNLVRLFGDVPLVTLEVTGLRDNYPSRATQEQVYELIIGDLTAAEDLPVTYPATEVGRATSGAAKALLAKVHLTRKEWSLAAAKAKEVTDLGVYGLLPDYGSVFTVANKNSRESIFEVQYFVGAQSGTGNPISNNFFELFAPDGSGSAVTGIPNANAFGRNIPTNDVIAAYEAGDARKDASVRTSYTRPGNPPEVVNANYIVKFLDPSASAGGLGTGSSNGWRVLRYADVLLMQAEALNELGYGNNAAFEALNAVRNRAKLPGLTAVELPGQQAFREHVYRERRVELAFENQRWFDLVRTGRLLDVLKSKNIQPRNVLMPVPQRERDLNPNLSQNDGYGM